jgi:hypothetical protein
VEGGDPFRVTLSSSTMSATTLSVAGTPQVTTTNANGTMVMNTTFGDLDTGRYPVHMWTLIAGTYTIVPSLCVSSCSSAANAVYETMAPYAVQILPGDTDPGTSAIQAHSVQHAGVEMTIDIVARDVFGNDQVCTHTTARYQTHRAVWLVQLCDPRRGRCTVDTTAQTPSC